MVKWGEFKVKTEMERNLRLALIHWASLVTAGKESAGKVGDLGSIPGLERSLEKGMATHFSILASRIPWTV